jgi:hypothetical protein
MCMVLFGKFPLGLLYLLGGCYRTYFSECNINTDTVVNNASDCPCV